MKDEEDWRKCASGGRTLLVREVRSDGPAHRASEARLEEARAQLPGDQRRERIAHADLVAVIEHWRTCGRNTSSASRTSPSSVVIKVRVNQ